MQDLMINGHDFPTLKAGALAKINQGMVEQARVGQIFGRQNSQTTAKLMSLNMLSCGAYRRLRQCAAEIEKRKNAVVENTFKLRRISLEAQKLRLEAETVTGIDYELKILEAEEKEQGLVSAKTYMEGSLKDIAAFQDAYEQIRTQYGIRENWDEHDFETAEVENHLQQAFLLGYRDMMQTGHLQGASLEYLQQFGVHPATAYMRIRDYISSTEILLGQKVAPTIDHLYTWLEQCAIAHKDDVKRAVSRAGMTELLTKWSLYIEPEGSK